MEDWDKEVMRGGIWIGLRELAQSVGILYYTLVPNEREHSPERKIVKRIA